MKQKIFYIINDKLKTQTQFLEGELGCAGESIDFFVEHDNADFSKEHFITDFIKLESDRLEQAEHDLASIYLSVSENGSILDDMDNAYFSNSNSSNTYKFNDLSLSEQKVVVDIINQHNNKISINCEFKEPAQVIAPSENNLLNDAESFLKSKISNNNRKDLKPKLHKSNNKLK
ncbi:hypothetical protein [Vibrio sp. 1CM23M]|uniref:hypothetical protein n=1 Tax=Vibrio sp. 1CM23M TaxID=2929164 RepID=UPI0020C046D2|nr:hypothetical protein [Vibrio sp. 1CM23M]MCK8072463.1 hypothetical protein [Vibrio sp. 1CM23M]